MTAKRIEVIVNVHHVLPDYVPELNAQKLYKIHMGKKTYIVYLARIDLRRCFVVSFSDDFMTAQEGMSAVSKGRMNEKWSPSAKSRLLKIELETWPSARPIPGWYPVHNHKVCRVNPNKKLRVKRENNDTELIKIHNVILHKTIPLPYESQKTRFDKYMKIVKVENIPNCPENIHARGVVAKRDIRINDEIGMYFGYVDTNANTKNDENNVMDSYTLECLIGNHTFVIDGNGLDQVSAMINDPRGTDSKSNIYVKDYFYTDMGMTRFAVTFVATKNIKKGEAILWSYGDESYWKLYESHSNDRLARLKTLHANMEQFLGSSLERYN